MSSMHPSQIRGWVSQSPPVEWATIKLRELLIRAIKQGPIPQHIAFVMDGNRRFAKTQKIETVEGHNLGSEALAKILEVCYKSGVRVVTIYAFSIENFKRSKYEVDHLMSMAKVKLSQLAEHGELFHRFGASIRVLGRREIVKPDVLEAVDRAVEMTKHNKETILNICFPYTSRDEITTAIRDTVVEYSTPILAPPPSQQQRPFSETRIAHNIRSRHLSTAVDRLRVNPHAPTFSGPSSDAEDSTQSSSTTLHPDSPTSSIMDEKYNLQQPPQPTYPDPETITQDVLSNHMFTAGMPPLDLLIRTSGVERLSDFMLWQCHQDTEIVFIKCLWPKFDIWEFLPVLIEWQWKRRKEGEHGEKKPERRKKGNEVVKLS